MRIKLQKLITRLVFIFCCALSVNATIRTVGKTGATYTTFAAAMTAAAKGDTIRFVNGPSSYYNSASINLKSVYIQGSYGITQGRDSLLLGQVGINFLTPTDSGAYFENLWIGWRDSTGVASTNRIMSSNNYGGFKFINCVFYAQSYSTNRRGLEIGRTNSTYNTTPMLFYKCMFINLHSALVPKYYNAGRYVDSALVSKCLFYKSGLAFGSKFRVDSCLVIGLAGENMAVDSLINLTISNCRFNAQNYSSEYITFDQGGVNRNKNVKVLQSTLDSNTHVNFMGDNIWDNELAYCIMGITGTPYYNHNSGTVVGTDTCSWLVRLHHIYMSSPSANITIAGNSTDTIFQFVVDSSIVANGSANVSWVKNDTLKNTVFAQNNPSKTGWHTELNLVTNAGTSYLLSPPYFPYHKANIPTYKHAGSHKNLLNFKDTISKTSNSFAVICSLAQDFRHDNSVYVDSFWVKNTWYNCDSARFFMRVSTDKSNWTVIDSCNLKRAGSLDTLNFIGGSGSTKYYYQPLLLTSTQTGSLRDTLPIDSITTLNGGPAVIDSLQNYRLKRGGVFKIFGTNLPDSGSGKIVKLNTLDLGKSGKWSSGQIWDTIPANAPRGFYTLRIFNGTDTVAVSNVKIRVLVPEIISGGN